MDNRAIAAKLREAAERLQGRGDALEALPGVGTGIAGAIAEMLTTDCWRYLERLRESERAFTYVDEEGIERQCVVLEPRPRSRLHGRDAIAAMLRGERA
jgi:hypothetical protein